VIQNTTDFYHRGNESWILVEMKSERVVEVNHQLHFSTDDVTSYEKIDEFTYILNVSSHGVTENETIVFHLLPDELRDLSNLSNSRTQDFVWIFDDTPPTIDVTCDAFSASKENVVTFTVRNSGHSKHPESIVTLTEENLDYDRERLVLVDLVLLENVSSVYLATFNTSYQLVPFTVSVREGKSGTGDERRFGDLQYRRDRWRLRNRTIFHIGQSSTCERYVLLYNEFVCVVFCIQRNIG